MVFHSLELIPTLPSDSLTGCSFFYFIDEQLSVSASAIPSASIMNEQIARLLTTAPSRQIIDAKTQLRS